MSESLRPALPLDSSRKITDSRDNPKTTVIDALAYYNNLNFKRSNAAGQLFCVCRSWGEFWGLNGYIRMSRNNGNQCAIASYAELPVM